MRTPRAYCHFLIRFQIVWLWPVRFLLDISKEEGLKKRTLWPSYTTPKPPRGISPLGVYVFHTPGVPEWSLINGLPDSWAYLCRPWSLLDWTTLTSNHDWRPVGHHQREKVNITICYDTVKLKEDNPRVNFILMLKNGLKYLQDEESSDNNGVGSKARSKVENIWKVFRDVCKDSTNETLERRKGKPNKELITRIKLGKIEERKKN